MKDLKVEITQLLRKIPGLNSQAQYDAAHAAMEVVCLELGLILGRVNDHKSRNDLVTALDLVEKATDLYLKLSEVPEAATSPAAEAYKQPPAQLTEEGVVDSLLSSLLEFQDKASLMAWYQSPEVKSAIAGVVSQSLRNRLLDTIRLKLRMLTQVTTRVE